MQFRKYLQYITGGWISSDTSVDNDTDADNDIDSMSDAGTRHQIACNFVSNNKRCNRKYFTLKGLSDHFTSDHSIYAPGLTFDQYRRSYTNTVVIPGREPAVPPKPAQLQAARAAMFSPTDLAKPPEPTPNRKRENELLDTKATVKESDTSKISGKPDTTPTDNDKMSKLKKRLKKLEKRMDRMEHPKRYCIICWKNDNDYALIPCGHKIVCCDCAVALLGGSTKCPVCSKRVEDMLRVIESGIEESADSAESE